MQGPGSIEHLMEGNDGVLPEDAHLMHGARKASGAPLNTNGKAANHSWLGRRKESTRCLSAGSWGAQPPPVWQLSTTSLSLLVVASVALGAGGACLLHRRL